MVHHWGSMVHNWSSVVCVDWGNVLHNWLGDDGVSVDGWRALRDDGIESVDWIGGVVDLVRKTKTTPEPETKTKTKKKKKK